MTRESKPGDESVECLLLARTVCRTPCTHVISCQVRRQANLEESEIPSQIKMDTLLARSSHRPRGCAAGTGIRCWRASCTDQDLISDGPLRILGGALPYGEPVLSRCPVHPPSSVLANASSEWCQHTKFDDKI